LNLVTEKHADVAEPELAVDLLGIERKDFFGSLMRRLRGLPNG
jgi:hypothetical protein